MSCAFYFQRRQSSLDIRSISKCDVDRIVDEVDIDALQNHLENVAFSALNEDDLQHLPDPLIVKLFRLAQLLIEYLLYAQDQLTNNLKKLAQKYASKKRDILRKRKEVLQLQESTATMKTQIKVKKQNIKTLEMLIEKTGKEKLIENKENLQQQQQQQAIAHLEKIPSSSSLANAATNNNIGDGKIVLYIVNAKDCQTIFISLDRTIESIKDECKNLISNGAVSVEFKYKGSVLDSEIKIRDAGVKNEDQIFIVEDFPQGSHQTSNSNNHHSNNNNVYDSEEDAKVSNKSRRDVKKTSSRRRPTYSSGDDSDEVGRSGSDSGNPRQSKSRGAHSFSSETDKNIVTEFLKVLESREKTVSSQSQGESMLVLREMKDMMESFMKTAVKTIAESRPTASASNEGAANIDTSVLIIEKWNKLETTIKSEFDKRLSTLSAEANSKLQTKKNSNFGVIASDSDQSDDDLGSNFGSSKPTASGRHHGKKEKEKESIQQHSKFRNNALSSDQTSAFSSTNRAVEVKLDTRRTNSSISDDEVTKITSTYQPINTDFNSVVEITAVAAASIADEPTISNESISSSHLSAGTTEIDSNEMTQVDATVNTTAVSTAQTNIIDSTAATTADKSNNNSNNNSNSNSRSTTPPIVVVEQEVQDVGGDRRPPQKPRRSASPATIAKSATGLLDPNAADAELEAVSQKPPERKLSRPTTPTLDAEKLPISRNLMKLFFGEYYDTDTSSLQRLSPPLDLTYKSESHIDTIVFQLRRAASDKLKISYQNIYFRLDNDDVKLGIDLQAVQASQIPLLCQQGRFRLASSSIKPSSSMDSVQSNIADRGLNFNTLTSSAQIDELLSKFKSVDMSQDSLTSSLDQQLPTRISAEFSKKIELEVRDSNRNPANLQLLQRKLQDEYLELSDKERFSDEEYKSKKITMSQLKELKMSSEVVLHAPIVDNNPNSEVDFQRSLLEQELKRLSERTGGLSDDELMGKIAELKKSSRRTNAADHMFTDDARKSIDSDILTSSRASESFIDNSNVVETTNYSSYIDENDSSGEDNDSFTAPIPDAKVVANDQTISEQKNSSYSSTSGEDKNAAKHADSIDGSIDNSFLKSNLNNFRAESKHDDSSTQVYSSFESGNGNVDNSVNNKSIASDSNVVEQNDSGVYDFVDDPSSDSNNKSVDNSTFLTASLEPNVKSGNVSLPVASSFDSNSTSGSSPNHSGDNKHKRQTKASINSRYYDDDDDEDEDDQSDGRKSLLSASSVTNTKDSLDMNSTLNTDNTATNQITPFSTTEIVKKADNYEAAARFGHSDVRDSTASALTNDSSEVQAFVDSESGSNSNNSSSNDEGTGGVSEHITVKKGAGQQQRRFDSSPVASRRRGDSKDEANDATPFKSLQDSQDSPSSADQKKAPVHSLTQSDDSGSLAFSESNQDDNSLVRSFDSK